jgi:hypothetical protein
MCIGTDDHPQPLARRIDAKSTLGRLAGDRKSGEIAGGPTRNETSASRAGRPASSAMTRSTVFSAAIAPDASSQEMPWIEAQEINMSNNRLALVGAAGMNPRNRGLSAEMMLGAITEE